MPESITPLKSKQFKEIKTNFDIEKILAKKNEDLQRYNINLQKETSHLKEEIEVDKLLQEEIWIESSKDYKKLIWFLEKNWIIFSDLINFKEVFIYLKQIYWKWFDEVFIANKQDPKQYIIKSSIDIIKSVKKWEYKYEVIKSILENKNIAYNWLFWSKRAIFLLWWKDIIDFTENKNNIFVLNYIRNNNISINLWNWLIIQPYDFNFNLVLALSSFLQNNKINFDQESIKIWIELFTKTLKEKIDKKYDWLVFFSVDQYDSWNQFKNDWRLYENISKSIDWNDSINIRSNYEFAKKNIIESIKKLKWKWKKNILLYISCHWSENWDSYFNDYNWVWKIQKIFSKSDLEEISETSNWICEFDKCYWLANIWKNINIICWNYIWNTKSKLRLIKWLEENNFNYNIAKIKQLLDANTYISLTLQ